MSPNFPKNRIVQYFPQIQNETNGGVFYGGDQNWYPRHTCRKSGCGPVAAANLVALYTQTVPRAAACPPQSPGGPFTRRDYLALMEQSYQTMGTSELPLLSRWHDKRRQTITSLLAESSPAAKAKAEKMEKSFLNKIPPSFGNNTRSFIRGTLRLGEQYHLCLRPRVLKTWRCGRQEALDFIRSGLAKNAPIVLLTRFNAHKIHLYPDGMSGTGRESRITTPHFMTILDILPKDNSPSLDLVVSTWGMLAAVPYDELYSSWQKPGALRSSLIYFEEGSANNGT